MSIRTFGVKIWGSLGTLYKAIPRDRATLMAAHRHKVGLLKEAGLKTFLADGVRTTINILSVAVLDIVPRAAEGPTPATPEELTLIYMNYPFLKYLPDALAREVVKYCPPVALPLVLHDKINGYTCYQLPINEANRSRVEVARSLVSNSLAAYGYVGWSNEIDLTNDAQAHYFVVEDSAGEIVATSRMIHKTGHNTIPLEQGVKDDGGHYSLAGTGRQTVDINSFYFKKGHVKALFPLFGAMGRFAWLNGVQRAFCMLDENNTFIRRLYTKAGFRFSKTFKEKIFFPTFGRETATGFLPVRWTLLEMGALTILFHGLRANKFQFR